MGKVRVYDLAKELKLENRKVIEDARRLGVDVSVPSNTLDDAIADKIREMYFPKKEPVTTHRSARLIKHAPLPAPTEAPAAAPQAVATQPAEQATALAPAKAAPAPAKQETRKITPLPVPSKVQPVAAQSPAPAPAPAAPPVEEAPKPKVIQLPTPAAAPAPEPQEMPAQEETAAPAPAVEAPAAPAPVQPVAEPPVAPAAEPEKPAPAAPAPTPARHRPAAPSPVVSASGQAANRVIKLAPAKPFQKPAPPPAPPQARAGREVTGREASREGVVAKSTEGRPERRRGQGVHLLESGKPQLHTYVPPPDARHKGRHAHRAKGEKQEAQDKLQPRRPVAVAQQIRQVPLELKPLRLVEGTTVREFAEKIEAKPRDVVSELMKRGVMATINQTINPDIAKEIGKQFAWEITFGEFEEMIVESEFEIAPEVMEDTDLRAPVVTVMGHVDHGKTSLLDAIRSARVAEGEAGGITQHIGAYSVTVPNPDNPADLRRVVFLDTPGHEAFTMMRARGAKVTDIVVLVVAADDGVMPQTIEAIEHAKAANVPIIVAINKIDKGDANPERVKKELADRGLLWDGWGGDTTMVEVSAKMKQNINGLLEMILLQADLMELKANPKRMATGTVLEAKLDRGRGAVATVLVQNGSLRIGEPFIVGNYFGKVRALMNDRGERVEEVGPAMPVEVLGLEGVPAAGDQFQVVSDVSKAQRISQFRQAKARTTALARTAARGLDQLAKQMETGEVKELLVILKADVQGSVEVLKDTLQKLSTDKVKVRIIRAAVGAITYDDVLLASASNATSVGAATVIIGFNVRPEARAEEAAKQEEVDIRLHSIIYKVEEEIRNAMIGMLDATTKEVVIGKAEIRDVIRVPKVGSVAGCMVTSGSIRRTAQARLIRNNVVIFEAPIGSLRRFKDDVSEVQQGYECGITIERFNDYKVGDVIEAYVTEKVIPTKL
jgi:translation initiation factor IF-2